MEPSKKIGVSQQDKMNKSFSADFGTCTSGLSRRGESRPLLPEAERQKSRMLLSVQADIGRGALFTMRLSKWYLLYCMIMALTTLALVVYMIVDVHMKGHNLTVWAVAIDGAITLIMCIETAVDWIALGKQFWDTGWHIFDFAVALTSAVTWLLMLLEVVGIVKNFDQYVTIVLLTCRYTTQTIRIIRYIRTGTQAQDALAAVEEQPVVFESQKGPFEDEFATGFSHLDHV